MRCRKRDKTAAMEFTAAPVLPPPTRRQVTYYRYFRFFGDGRVAYGLTHENPKEFVRMLQVINLRDGRSYSR